MLPFDWKCGMAGLTANSWKVTRHYSVVILQTEVQNIEMMSWLENHVLLSTDLARIFLYFSQQLYYCSEQNLFSSPKLNNWTDTTCKNSLTITSDVFDLGQFSLVSTINKAVRILYMVSWKQVWLCIDTIPLFPGLQWVPFLHGFLATHVAFTWWIYNAISPRRPFQ